MFTALPVEQEPDRSLQAGPGATGGGVPSVCCRVQVTDLPGCQCLSAMGPRWQQKAAGVSDDPCPPTSEEPKAPEQQAVVQTLFRAVTISGC